MTDETVRVEREAGVGTIRLDRPESNNSMDAATAEALREAGAELASDDDIRCIALTGTGATLPCFAAG